MVLYSIVVSEMNSFMQDSSTYAHTYVCICKHGALSLPIWKKQFREKCHRSKCNFHNKSNILLL